MSYYELKITNKLDYLIEKPVFTISGKIEEKI